MDTHHWSLAKREVLHRCKRVEDGPLMNYRLSDSIVIKRLVVKEGIVLVLVRDLARGAHPFFDIHYGVAV